MQSPFLDSSSPLAEIAGNWNTAAEEWMPRNPLLDPLSVRERQPEQHPIQEAHPEQEWTPGTMLYPADELEQVADLEQFEQPESPSALLEQYETPDWLPAADNAEPGTELESPQAGGELTPKEYAKAFELNLKYARDLRVNGYFKLIIPFLSKYTGLPIVKFQENTPDPWLMVRAVSEYQEKKYQEKQLPRPENRGVIGLGTWTLLQRDIGLHQLTNRYHIDIRRAIRYNDHYEKTALGKTGVKWGAFKEYILGVFSRTEIGQDTDGTPQNITTDGLPLDKAFFALAIAEWQKIKFPAAPQNVHGILGPVSWPFMQYDLNSLFPNLVAAGVITKGQAAQDFVDQMHLLEERVGRLSLFKESQIDTNIDIIEVSSGSNFLYLLGETVLNVISKIASKTKHPVGKAVQVVAEVIKGLLKWKKDASEKKEKIDTLKTKISLSKLLENIQQKFWFNESKDLVEAAIQNNMDLFEKNGGNRQDWLNDFINATENLKSLVNDQARINQIILSQLINAIAKTRLIIDCNNDSYFTEWEDKDINVLIGRTNLKIEFTKEIPDLKNFGKRDITAAEEKILKALWTEWSDPGNKYDLKDLLVDKHIFFRVNLGGSGERGIYDVFMRTMHKEETNWETGKTTVHLYAADPTRLFFLEAVDIPLFKAPATLSYDINAVNTKGKKFTEIITRIVDGVMAARFNTTANIGRVGYLAHELPVAGDGPYLNLETIKTVNPPACSVDSTKANKIGFEFDMLISISSDLQAKTIADKEIVSNHTLSGDGFVLKIDGNKIEVSTKPFELSDSGRKDLQETFSRIESWIGDLKDHFKRSKKTVHFKKSLAPSHGFSGNGIYLDTAEVGKALQIKDKYSTPTSYFIFPLHAAVTNPDDYFTDSTTVRGVPQTTMGVPLASVNKLVDKIHDTENQRIGIALSVSGAGWRLGLRSDALYNAQYRVNAARKYFLKLGTFDSLKIDHSNFSDALTGFLILLLEYLWTSVLPEDPRDREGFSKAYVPLHSKTRFREMFHCLLTEGERELFMKVFWEGDNWKNLFSLTRKIEGRQGGYTDINTTPDIKLFPDFIVRAKPSWKAFVTSVVENDFSYEQPSGYDSLVTDPTSGAIPLTTNGAVLEFRRMGFGTLVAEKWRDMAERLFKIARELNGAAGMVHETFDENFEIADSEENLEAERASGLDPLFETEEYERTSAKHFIPVLIRRLQAGKPYSIFDPATNNQATRQNQTQIKKSGLPITDIRSALARTIDLGVIQELLVSHNQLSPGNIFQVNPGSADADAVFTEAIHQFQIANYLDPGDQDGVMGRSTIETLGFIKHGLKDKLNSAAFYGQKQLNSKEIKPEVPVLTGNEFSAQNWYEFIVKPSWLGVKITDGIHVLLLRKLREAETWLLSRPEYQGMTPAALGRALGFNKDTRYSGARLSSAKEAMHGFGLALDINVAGNPWIGAGWVKHDKELFKERSRMISTLRNAAADPSLPGHTVFAYLHSITVAAGNDTTAAYAILKQRNDQFITYLKNNPAELRYWKQSQTFHKRDPLNGFLNLHPDLVYALRQIAGLAWGAIDFGPNASGDIMHFDLRTIGVGKFLADKVGGYIPTAGHPAISRETSFHKESLHETDNEAFTDPSAADEWIQQMEWEEKDPSGGETQTVFQASSKYLNTWLTLTGANQGPIKGGGTQKGREGAIGVYQFHHEMVAVADDAAEPAPGQRRHQPLWITKEIDQSSVKLLNALVNRERLTELVINFYQKENNYYRITLTNAAIINITQELSLHDPRTEMKLPLLEKVSFEYQKVEWAYLADASAIAFGEAAATEEIELHEAIEEAAWREDENELDIQ